MCRRTADKVCPSQLSLFEGRICQADPDCTQNGDFVPATDLCDRGLAPDTKAPHLYFAKRDNLFTGGAVAYFEDLRVVMADNLDDAPQLTGLKLTGGPDDVSIDLSPMGPLPVYTFDVPLLPRTKESPYTLTAYAKDWRENSVQKSVDLEYVPRIVEINGGLVKLPAAAHTFGRMDGQSGIASPVIELIDGGGINGSADVEVMLESDSEVSLSVGGQALSAGERGLIEGYDFSSSRGKIGITLAPQDQSVGASTVLLKPKVPYAPTVRAQVETWLGALSWDPSEDLQIEQMLEVADLSAQSNGLMNCTLTTSEDNARSRPALSSNPYCLMQWEPSASGLENYFLSPPRFRGRVHELGPQGIDYTVSVFDHAGNKVDLFSDRFDFEVIAPQDFEYGPNADLNDIARTVEKLDFELEQKSGIPCRLAVTSQEAKDAASRDKVLCYPRFTLLPGTLAFSQNAYTPRLQGQIDELGEHEMAWEILTFTREGEEIVLGEGSSTITVNDPPAPTLSILSRMEQLENGTYVGSQRGGTLGYAQVGVPRKAARVTMEVKGVEDSDRSYQYATRSWMGADDIVTFTRLLQMDEAPLWSKEPVQIKAYYTELPEISATIEPKVLRVPDERTKLILKPNGEALDTTGVPFKLKLGEVVGADVIYNEDRHGLWTVQMGMYENREITPLMEPRPMTDGVWEGVLNDVSAGKYSFIAESTIKSPDGEYERTIESNRYYTVVFKGTEPDAKVNPSRYSGVAPFSTVLMLQMDTESRMVLGEITWEVSEDGGKTWKPLEQESYVPWRKYVTFEAGIYQVRAEVENSKTGARGYTETIEINSFHVPKLELSGPKAVFVGDELTIDAKTTIDGEPVDAIIQWETLRGELLSTGDTYNYKSDEPTTLMLNVRAKLPDSPDDNPRAWDEQRYYVKIMPPRAPRGRVVVPGYMEAGKTYTINASNLLLPYTGMDTERYPIEGRWTLPDGTTIDEPVYEYTATVADAEAKRISFYYSAWIKGHKSDELTATWQRRVATGQYIWPDFEIRQIIKLPQAPADVTLYALSTDTNIRLEDPQYTWSLPASAEVVYDAGMRLQARFKEPGIHEVTCDIVDRRGFEATVTAEVEVVEPDPFDIEFYTYESNPYGRAPLSVRLSPRVSGGHPRDRMGEFDYFLNDEKLPDTGSTGIALDLEAGIHVIDVQGTSQMGATASAQHVVVVNENTPPECEVEKSFYDGSYPVYRFKANCEDADGRVTGYQWLIDGKSYGSSSNLLSLAAPKGDQTVRITMTATDDSGDSVTIEEIIP
ncbi:hypothetical protein GSUB_16470 (plasmid) [Geoalkalibacter subterraneus]|uniref:Ig-like domain-containing protein n=1 Tax=Geoalkalibacter subterraneus TaxID=483547 RepID=A0A0B5FWX6_9BACT|nr:hypothetical protein GSUB_16470 [Geoalkalibacter subterraneus]